MTKITPERAKERYLELIQTQKENGLLNDYEYALRIADAEKLGRIGFRP